MKTQLKKLQLNKKTIQNLASGEMAAKQAGAGKFTQNKHIFTCMPRCGGPL